MNRTLMTLIKMRYIYNPDGFDWMNFKFSKDNQPTYHHIVERRHGGHLSVENGAILSDFAHQLLNILDLSCKKAYNDLQNVFMKIIASNSPPTYEVMKEIDEILYKIFFTEEYVFTKYINISWYRHVYLESRKELKKCLI